MTRAEKIERLEWVRRALIRSPYGTWSRCLLCNLTWCPADLEREDHRHGSPSCEINDIDAVIAALRAEGGDANESEPTTVGGDSRSVEPPPPVADSDCDHEHGVCRGSWGEECNEAPDGGAVEDPPMTDEEVERWAAKHYKGHADYGSDACGLCVEDWPCPFSLLVREVKRLREEIGQVRTELHDEAKQCRNWRISSKEQGARAEAAKARIAELERERDVAIKECEYWRNEPEIIKRLGRAEEQVTELGSAVLSLRRERDTARADAEQLAVALCSLEGLVEASCDASMEGACDNQRHNDRADTILEARAALAKHEKEKGNG